MVLHMVTSRAYLQAPDSARAWTMIVSPTAVVKSALASGARREMRVSYNYGPMDSPDPYTQFNFKLKVAGGAVLAGFQELSGMSPELPRKKIAKITGLNKSTDVTLKRRVINAPALLDWLKQAH